MTAVSAPGHTDSPVGFTIGAGVATYRGPVGVGSLHRHAAFQIVLGSSVVLLDDRATRTSASAVLVSPMTLHTLLPTTGVVTHFVEPHCVFADRLRDEYGNGIVAAPSLSRLGVEDLAVLVGQPSERLDPRLVHALTCVTRDGAALAELPSAVGLSAQRLRALARQQLGMSLVRWRIWSRLRFAAESLQQGHTLATAAQQAGFADQAHFTRQLREMMGVTPAALLPILRPAYRRAT